MLDSTFTLYNRQEAIFGQGFQFTGQVYAERLVETGSPQVLERGSFIMSNVPVKAISPALHASISADWIFWVILGGFFLLTLTKFYYEKRLGLIFSAVFSRSSANILIRESSVFRFQSFIYLLVIYLVSITLFIYQLFRFIDPSSGGSWRDMLLYVEIVGAFLAFFITKIIMIRLAGFIFKNADTATEYIQTMFIFNLFAGVVLLPIMLFIQYSYAPLFLFLSVGILLIVMILRFIRGLIVGLSDHKFSLFHLILYLCTLEILPVLVIAKFIDKYFFS